MLGEYHMEEWRDIKHYEGYYQVSNLGNVRSLRREVRCGKGTRILESQIKRPVINGSGYLQVNLSKNGISSFPYVHKLVAEAFIGNPDNHTEVNHIDHNKLNCRSENLEWCTRQENMIALAEFVGNRQIRFFCDCGREVSKENNRCSKCSRESRRLVKNRPSVDELTKKTKTRELFCCRKRVRG